ncbi:ATP-binding protein [Nocardioides glacieisoli]|nr:ATP-binding protein [Nocardioides glacieisoli]
MSAATTAATPWRVTYAVTAAAGVVALAAVQHLPWLETEFRVGPGVRWTMVVAGLLVLVAAARAGTSGGVAAALLVLGGSVLAYPTLLTLAAADVGGPVVATLGAAGHVVPLTMVQLVPVLVSGRVTGRSRRGWATTILAVAAVGALVTGLGLALGDRGLPLAAVGTILWFVSFAFPPIACWTAVRRTIGQARRRGIVAGLAALVPVLVIVWCVTLGGLGSALGLADDPTTQALFLGFSGATAGCALLAVAALGDGSSSVLRRSAVVLLLRAMVVGVVVLVASGVALASATLLPTREAAVLVAVGLTVLLGWGATRLLGWAAMVVDPAVELRLELERAAELVDGRHRQVAESVVRRLAEDGALELAYAVDRHTWVGSSGRVASPSDPVVLGSEEGRGVVVLLTDDPVARRHARAWGDCSTVFQPALMEAREAWQAGRAALAADDERSRLQQDLHDGLQGRLIGLALNLQLSQSGTEDPVARLAIEETVTGLRSAVQDVRAMADGRLPQILVDDGLEAAVRALLQPVRARIGILELAADPSGRRPLPTVEACAYYVVGEAVGNAIKHAACDRIDVSLGMRDGSVVVRVRDDGDGGADARLGSGLRGLAERVEAHGGLLVVSNGEDSGTLVEAVLPCGW